MLSHVAIRALRKLENVAGSMRRALEDNADAHLEAKGINRMNLDKPNSPEAWEALYHSDVMPVNAVNTPVASAIADLTQRGDLLLEVGCGSGMLSAELATIGRVIELCDFSARILDRAKELFRVSGLPAPRCTLCDITKPFPWPDGSVDVVWSSGVLEHWTDDELRPIVREMARISRKRVISLVPYVGCFSYRLGRHFAEVTGKWPYGREFPRDSLASVFHQAGLRVMRERVIWSDVGIEFLSYLGQDVLREARSWWRAIPRDDPLRNAQGYLLLTVGEKSGVG